MIKLKKIKLKNVVTYQDAEFEFKEGISLISGNNGCGKSLLFSSIPNLLYFSHPLSRKDDAKSLFLGSKEDSCISLDLETKHNYLIEQYSTKTKSSLNLHYRILEDNVDLEYKTITPAKEKIEQIFNQSQNIFYTCTYLTSYKNHPLLHGSTSQRYEFFELLFNFEIFDFLYEKFSEQEKLLNFKDQELNSILNFLKDKQEVFSQHQITSCKVERSNNLLAKLSDLNNIFASKLLEIQKEIKLQNLIEQKIEKLKDIAFKSKEGLQNEILNLKTDLSNIANLKEKEKLRNEKKLELEKLKEKIQTNSYLQAKENFLKSKIFQNLNEEEIPTFIGNKIQDLNLKLQERSYSFWLNLIEDYKIKQKKLSEVIGKPEDYIQKLSLAELLERLTRIDQSLAEYNFKYQNNIEKIKEFEKIKEPTCPTCSSVLDLQNILKLKEECIKEAQNCFEKSKKFKPAKEALENLIKVKKDFKDLSEEQLLNYINQKKEFENFKAILYNLKLKEQEYLKAEEQIKLLSEFLNLNIFQGGAPELDEQALKNNLSNLESQLEEIRNLESLKAQRNNLSSNSFKSSEELIIFLKEFENKSEKNLKRFNKVQSYVIDKKVNLKNLEEKIKEISLKENRKIQLLEELKNYPIIQALAKTFHSKGFRVEKINSLLKIFESLLNKYSSFLFKDDFSFSIQLEKKDLHIFAHRNGASSDIGFLSGSESRRFQLACLISILTLLPSSLRSNAVILDEMDAGMDYESSKMYYEKFLPELKSLVSSIVIITPLQDNGYYFIPDYRYEVVKENNVSFLAAKQI